VNIITVMSDLINAASEGDIGAVRRLLELGADPADNDSYALGRAACYGHNSIVTLLIQAGADVAASDNEAVRLAAYGDRLSTVTLLIRAGADVTAADNYAITHAARNGNALMVKLLIDEGADVTVFRNLPLFYAVQRGHTAAARALLAGGACVSSRDNAALCMAIEFNDVKLAQVLLEWGAVYHGIMGAIHTAIKEAHAEIMKFLIEREFDISTASHQLVKWAAESDDHTIMQMLVEHTAQHSEYRYVYDTAGDALYIFHRTDPMPWCSNLTPSQEFIEKCISEIKTKKSATSPH
jgi:ankyrin repeat protein